MPETDVGSTLNHTQVALISRIMTPGLQFLIGTAHKEDMLPPQLVPYWLLYCTRNIAG